MAGELKTALITGASSGIGAAFASILAQQEYNLLLVARRQAKLEALAGELAGNHGVTADILVADLAQPGDVERVEQKIRLMPRLDMLVNNAGFGTMGHFADVELAKHLDMIHVHVIAAVRFTHAALPGMIARKHGDIINVSSGSAYLAMPNAVTYCSSKMYLITFAEALAKELEGTGVRVQTLCPGFTYTEFHDTPEFQDFKRTDISKGLWMNAEDVARESLAALDSNRAVFIPGRKNRLLIGLSRTRLGPILLGALAKKRWKK
ncbi:MAG: SDR family oxidoreductase [Candidatus Hydrogenedentes bacterium]|nr:SDR family oxidoreductase [Candidatus Hydrogenedentota bacterium]